MQYFKFENDKWTACDESELSTGDKFKKVDHAGGMLISFYTKTVKPNNIVITSHDKRALVMKGDDLTVDIEIQDSEGNLLDVNDSFAIPVGKVGAGNYTTLLVEFVSGKAARSYTWNDAGEFEITSAMINMHLDESTKFDFEGFNITVAG